MKNDLLMSYSGQLDAASRALESAAEGLAYVWDEGSVRLRPDEIKKIAQYLSSIRVSSSRVRDALKLFESIAQRTDGPQLLKKAATLEQTPTYEQANL